MGTLLFSHEMLSLSEFDAANNSHRSTSSRAHCRGKIELRSQAVLNLAVTGSRILLEFLDDRVGYLSNYGRDLHKTIVGGICVLSREPGIVRRGISRHSCQPMLSDESKRFPEWSLDAPGRRWSHLTAEWVQPCARGRCDLYGAIVGGTDVLRGELWMVGPFRNEEISAVDRTSSL